MASYKHAFGLFCKMRHAEFPKQVSPVCQPCMRPFSSVPPSISYVHLGIAKGHSTSRKDGKAHFLAFVFIPLSFTSSFFGMNVTMLKNDVDLKWWVVLSIHVLLGSLVLYYWDFERMLKQVSTYLWGAWVNRDRWLKDNVRMSGCTKELRI